MFFTVLKYMYEGQSHLKVLTANLQETKHPQRDTKQTSLRQEPIYFNFSSLPYYASTGELLNVTLTVQCNLLTEGKNDKSNIALHPGATFSLGRTMGKVTLYIILELTLVDVSFHEICKLL